MTDKLEKIVNFNDCERCFAVPGKTMIDVINPQTGLSYYYGKDLQKVREEHPDAVEMTVDEYCASKAKAQDTPLEWVETNEEKYMEMLEVLPPAGWQLGIFLVGEPWDHHALTGAPRFACYRQDGKQFRASNRPITRKEFDALVQNKLASKAAALATA